MRRWLPTLEEIVHRPLKRILVRIVIDWHISHIVSAVPEWARGYPGLTPNGTWDLASMRPGSLWFADEIHFDLRNIRGQKQSMLFMFDVVTGGMRVAFESSKRDRASSFAQIVAQEGLAHR